MKKNFFFFFFILNLLSTGIAENKYQIIASVNDKSITYIDVINELKILNLVNKKKIEIKQLKNIALNNLIEERIKEEEIKEKKEKTSQELINKYYSIFLQNLRNKENSSIELLENNLKKKIEIDINWNKIIQKNYSWKININMQEIDKIINETSKNISDEKKLEKIKEDLINIEKEKKLKVFSNYHLNKIKKNFLIKYY